MTRTSRPSPLLQLSLARLRAFAREPGALFWSFGFPLVLTLALGVAFRSRKPDPVSAVVLEGPGADTTAASLGSAPGIRARVLGVEAAHAALRAGHADILVAPGQPAVYEYDPTRPESRVARATVDDALQRAAGRADVVASVDRPATQPGSRYVDFLVPGLLGLNLLSSGMWGVGYQIVEDRKGKLLKRMVATPMRRSHFLLAFVFMRLLFLVVELPVLLLFARLAFDVHIQGSVALLVALSALGALSFTGVGILVASRAQNTATVSGIVNVVMMPMFVGSGVFFSTEHFPRVIHPLLEALPLTALNDALRAVVNEGAGVTAVLPQAAQLAVVGVVSFAIGVRIFRWT